MRKNASTTCCGSVWGSLARNGSQSTLTHAEAHAGARGAAKAARSRVTRRTSSRASKTPAEARRWPGVQYNRGRRGAARSSCPGRRRSSPTVPRGERRFRTSADHQRGRLWEELLSWSHWACWTRRGHKEPIKPKDPGLAQDTQTKLAASWQLLPWYVDWWDQYEKYPATPIMRPDACTDLTKWEAYMSMFRQYQLQRNV